MLVPSGMMLQVRVVCCPWIQYAPLSERNWYDRFIGSAAWQTALASSGVNVRRPAHVLSTCVTSIFVQACRRSIPSASAISSAKAS